MLASDTNTRAFRPATAIVVSGLLLCVLFFGAGATAAPESSSQSATAPLRQAQVLESDRTGLVAPTGLGYSGASESFHVVAAVVGGSPVTTDVVRLTPFTLDPVSDRAGSARIAAAIADPINVAFDTRRNRLLLLSHADRLLSVQADAAGELDPTTLVRRGALRLDLRDPQGMALDPESGTLFVLDATQPRIVRVEPDANGNFEQATISEIELASSGISSGRGLAFDPASGNLHLVSGQELLELTQTGEPVAVRDLSRLELESPQGMVFAPSGDQTDDPAQLSVYVADSGGGATRSSGQIVELSLAPLPEAASIDFTSSLVRTVDTATWSPPSPDPSGIAYLPASNRLMMADGEVEETVSGITHFQGANVWEFTLGGTVLRTANISTVPPTVVPMTDEPTGVAYKPSSGQYFYTDDGRKRVYTLNAGSDGLVGTSDDSWSYFPTNTYGNGDPEGIAYDPVHDRLFVSDGVNAEVYQYTLAGALVGQFDVATFGVGDPEGVEFDPASGTLFTLSNKASGPIIVETTTSGARRQTISVAAILSSGGKKPAGLAIAPASNGSGLNRFYIVDRGVDNNSDPRIVDGKMFELTSPATGPPVNQPPTVGAGSDQTITLPASATLDGTASDDGLPNPPGTLTTTWTKITGPGAVTFGNASAVDTTASFSLAGVYVLRLTANDGALPVFDELTLTVNPVGAGSPFYFALRDAATVGGVAAANEDIVQFDGVSAFSLYFDGSDVGIASLRIDAFARLDPTTLLLSFDSDKSVPGIGLVDDSDIVRFDSTSLGDSTAGTFSLYFDGSDVGLTASAHDVNAFELLPDGTILLSTQGSVTVGGLSSRDEDLLEFIPTSLGDNTAGTFSLYFDGSDVGLGDSGEDINAVAVDDASGKIYVSTLTTFAVPGVSGDDEDVFVFNWTTLGSTTTGAYASTLFFDGSAYGLTANDVYAIALP